MTQAIDQGNSPVEPGAGIAAPRRLERADVEPAAQALARAFFDDPMMQYIWPQDRMRSGMLPVFIAVPGMNGSKHMPIATDKARYAGDAVAAVVADSRDAAKRAADLIAVDYEPLPVVVDATKALFLPPGKTVIPPGPMMRVLLPDIWRWRPGPFMRFMGIVNEFEHKHPPQLHWYLLVLGVDPPQQGQGVGGVLISEELARADADKLPVYLETLKARNVPFYEKHGFAVREHFNCHGGRGPETWTMLRAPR